MDDKSNGFDPKSTKRIKKNMVGSPHSAFTDATGNICLSRRGRLSGGGVGFNKRALVRQGLGSTPTGSQTRHCEILWSHIALITGSPW